MDKALLARVQKQAWFHRFPRGLPLFVFLLVGAVVALGVYAIERANAQKRLALLDRQATEVAFALQQRSAENVAYLRAGAALFAASGPLSPDAFKEFYADLNQHEMNNGSLGLGWAERIETAERAAAEQEIGTRLGRAYRIFPEPGGAGLAYPIVYLEPGTDYNRSVIGYDMYSEGVRRAAMQQAERARTPIASGRVNLVQDKGGGNRAGFLVYMPVFDRSLGGTGRLRGFVYSPFRTADFLASAVALVPRSEELHVAVHDGSSTKAPLVAMIGEPDPSDLAVIKHVTIAERPWAVVIGTRGTPMMSALSQATILFGSLAAILLMLIARMVTARAIEDQQAFEWQSRQVGIRVSLTRELNHRVKNTLANVLSIIALTKRRATDLDSYVESLTGRVRALSATHDLLTRSEWGTTALTDVLTAELAPYIEDHESHVELRGPDVMLAPNEALSLGLAVHELATNAAKYGALSTLDGFITISWELPETDLVELTWRERGGPPVTEPAKRGFGRDLIEKIVAHELDSPVRLNFAADGVECVMRIPVREPQPFAIRHGERDG